MLIEIDDIKLNKPKRKKRRYNDPILDNSYNKGEVSFHQFDKKVEINKQYVSTRLDDSYNAHDYYRKELLNEEIADIYDESKWGKTYGLVKKVPKKDLTELFLHLRNTIKDITYTEIELFIEIADYLDIKYEILYEMIPNVYKKRLLNELDREFDNIQKTKILKLF